MKDETTIIRGTCDVCKHTTSCAFKTWENDPDPGPPTQICRGCDPVGYDIVVKAQKDSWMQGSLIPVSDPFNDPKDW